MDKSCFIDFITTQNDFEVGLYKHILCHIFLSSQCSY